MSTKVTRSPTKSTKKSIRKSPKKNGSPKKMQTFTSYYYTDLGITENNVEIDHLQSVIVSLKQKGQVINDIENELETKNSQLESNEQGRTYLQTQFREYIRKSEEDSRRNSEIQESLIKRNTELENEIKKEKLIVRQQHSQITRIEQELEIRKDIERELADSRQHVNELEGQKSELRKHLTIASNYLIEQDEKVSQANKTSLELLQHLREAEMEIETLKDYIVELKHRIAVYIPVESDSVDNRLAEYINNYPERNRLKVMFMRESSGIYQFGTKKVFVKVEKDKIIIRVGGGFLTIDEFLDIYTPLEIEKLERKSPLKKFSEKVAVQKTCIGREVREESPIRSPTRTSPLRRSSPKKHSSPRKYASPQK